MKKEEKKEYSAKDIKDLIDDILDFASGIDSVLDEYLKELKKQY